MAGRVVRIGSDERREGPATPGMTREEAVSTRRSWAGYVTAEAGTVSGWHHHGGYESVIYVLSGRLRMESGPGGTEVIDAGPGDFVFVDARAVHRESNPGEVDSALIVVRAGAGTSLVNVDGPEGSVDAM